MSEDTSLIDLDALTPPSATIKLNGETIEIAPPSLEDVMLLGSLSQKMSKFQGEDLEKASDAIAALTKQLIKCAPKLEGQKLNTPQLLKMVQVITDISMPPDAKELRDKGITPNDPKAAP